MSSFDERIEEKLDKLSSAVSELKVGVAEVSTKMSFLVGQDGTDGIVKDHGTRIAALEHRGAWLSGLFAAFGMGVGAAAQYVFRSVFHVR